MSSVHFFTFGTKYKRDCRPPADLHVNCTWLPNPPFYELTGRDLKVQRWLRRHIAAGLNRHRYDALATRILEASQAAERMQRELIVGFYCIGGRHRSVFVSESLVEKLSQAGIEVDMNHLELNRSRVRYRMRTYA
jgi:UPF0042 nucleotide-binding protein